MRSKERARDLGEVFTAEREVNAMLDLARDVNYASRFMEPGCGSGNFLVAILERKLAMVRALPEVRRSTGVARVAEYEAKSLMAIASIYGIDIDPQNVKEARDRVAGVMLRAAALVKPRVDFTADYPSAVDEIVRTNIVLGDLLGDLRTISLTEYSELPGRRVKRRLFTFDQLLFPADEAIDSANVLLPHVPRPYAELPQVPYRQLARPVGVPGRRAA